MNNEEAIRKYVNLVLLQMQKEGATELVIGPAKDEETPIRYKAGDKWLDLAPPPAHVRSGMVAELGRLANLPEGKFPKTGVIDLAASGGRSKWRVKATGAEAKWVLTPIAG